MTFLISFCFGYGLWLYRPVRFLLTDEREEIHVFLETYATNPALTHMVEFAKLPKKTPKIISWHRFPKRRDVLDLEDFNTVEIDIPAQEGMYSYSTNIVLEQIQKIAEADTNTVFVLHSNFSHTPITLFPFLRALPKERIKHIHLYEDGYGELLKRPRVYYNTNNMPKDQIIKNIQEAIFSKGEWSDMYILRLHYVYPVTYHLMGAEFFDSQENLSPVTAPLKTMSIQNVNFDTFKKTLTDEQKQIVMKLAGFDYNLYEPLIKNKKTIMFTMGFYFNNDVLHKAELNFLKKLKSNELDVLKNAEDYTWFYKPHPSYSTRDLSAKMAESFPDMIEVMPQIPYEIFILADLKPTKTVGFGSSLYYSLMADDVLAYIRRVQDTYLDFLLKAGKLRPEQIFNLKDFN
ncbi:MAG: hypothetical protein ACI4QM_02165 [Alphaproteobacteria bacterium]